MGSGSDSQARFVSPHPWCRYDRGHHGNRPRLVIARIGAVVALVFGLVAAVMPTVTVPPHSPWPPLEMAWRTTSRTGSMVEPTVVTVAQELSFTNEDDWSSKVVASDDQRAGAAQAGEETVVTGGTVTVRPCAGCAVDERERTNEAIAPAVAPGRYARFAEDPAIVKEPVDAPLGLNVDAVRVEVPTQFACVGILAECAPGAPGTPPGLAGGNVPAIETWTFVVLDADRASAVPVRHELRVGDFAVEDTVVDSLEIPSS